MEGLQRDQNVQNAAVSNFGLVFSEILDMSYLQLKEHLDNVNCGRYMFTH